MLGLGLSLVKAGSIPRFLLDKISGAVAAYSTRKLKAAFTSDVVEVRRSGDSAESGFTPTEITNGTLASWVSAGGGTEDGFVVTWYDQSGNGNNATQGTAANQPQIVDSGSVITENGKPAVEFDGDNDYLLQSSAGLSSVSEMFIPMVTSASGYGANKSGFCLSDGNNNPTGNSFFSIYPYDNSSGNGFRAYFNGGIILNEDDATRTGQILLTYEQISATDRTMYVDSISELTDSASKSITTGSHIYIGSNDADQPYNGKIQELILYDSDKSENRTEIENNINDYYEVY